MPIQDKLAFALNRKDQEPNKLLAKEIVNNLGEDGVHQLVDFFNTNPHKELQKDCALTMAWIAELKPELIAPQTNYLIGKLQDPINRVIWGSMIALAFVAHLEQERLYDAMPQVIDAMDAGTVVTRDHGYRIMITLYADSRFQEDLFVLIQEQLMKAPSNQLGQYAERLIEILNKSHLNLLIETLEERRGDISNEHHIKRLNKNLKKLYKQL